MRYLLRSLSALAVVAGALAVSASCSSKDDHPAASSTGGDQTPPPTTFLPDGSSDGSPDDALAPIDTASEGAPPDLGLDGAKPDSARCGCGVGCPSKCEVGKTCATGEDCESRSCPMGTCVAPTCTDMIKNGEETDVDCGGPSCGPCDDMKSCKAQRDCKSKVCVGLTCQVPTCNDGVQNGKETDIDCGGPDCPRCLVGRKCMADLDCVSKSCDTTKGACQCPKDMDVAPTKIVGGGSYCIDRAEVTNRDYYERFLRASIDPKSQPDYCKWNADFTPSDKWPYKDADEGKPVRYVNWCDGYAFCKAVGKRLCGKIPEGHNLPSDRADPDKSAWYNACATPSKNAYPYGKVTYDSLACNGSEFHFKDLPHVDAPYVVFDYVATTYQNVACEGGAKMIYQMSGNVAEWEDSCNDYVGRDDTCNVRGGAYDSDSTALRCDASATSRRDASTGSVGFRCCQ